MTRYGLKQPKDCRPTPGPCCFCKGKRPPELKGYNPAVIIECSITPVEVRKVGDPEMKPLAERLAHLKGQGPGEDELAEFRTPEVKATRPRKKTVAEKKAEAEASLLQARKKVATKAAAKKAAPKAAPKATPKPAPKAEEKPQDAAPKPAKKGPVAKQTPQQQKAVRMNLAVKQWLESGAPRGENEEFRFNEVKVKFGFGHGGVMPPGMPRIGREGQRTHFPERAIVVWDKETNSIASIAAMWACNDPGLFAELTARPKYSICKECFMRKFRSHFQIPRKSPGPARRANKEKRDTNA